MDIKATLASQLYSQVQAAAQFIRAKVFEPWKERAIAAGLLPEDVKAKGADSYLQRVYNKQAIAAQRESSEVEGFQFAAAPGSSPIGTEVPSFGVVDFNPSRDRKEQYMATLSNLLKKSSDTSQAITQNLK